MKLFLISQDENVGGDTYDSAVVCASNEAAAKLVRPDGIPWTSRYRWLSWCSSPENVTVKYLGRAASGVRAGVVCASFNAG